MHNAVNYDNVTVIILAGGKGTRMGISTPKQYLKLGNHMVMEYSINKFLQIFKKIYIVVPNLEKLTEELEEKYPIVTLFEAKDSRIASLQHVLGHVKTKYVLIHDASRPFVTKKIIDDVVNSLDKYKSAYPVMSLSSSIVEDKDGLLASSPDRSHFREIQTPQGFHADILAEALSKHGEKHIHIPELVRLLGHNVKHVDGSAWLFKITYPPDIHAARYYIKRERTDD